MTAAALVAFLVAMGANSLQLGQQAYPDMLPLWVVGTVFLGMVLSQAASDGVFVSCEELYPLAVLAVFGPRPELIVAYMVAIAPALFRLRELCGGAWWFAFNISFGPLTVGLAGLVGHVTLSTAGPLAAVTAIVASYHVLNSLVLAIAFGLARRSPLLPAMLTQLKGVFVLQPVISFLFLLPVVTLMTPHPVIALMGLVGCAVLQFSAYRTHRDLQEARHDANRDLLTGLLNRRSFAEHLDGAEDVSGTQSWMFVIDLDNFKQLNDSHGHDAGDHALIVAADQIRNAVADFGLCARFGGDEFVVLITDASRAGAEAIGQSIVHGIASSLGFLGISASIGAHQLHPGEDTASALNHADIAMYLSKRAGRGRLTFSDENASREHIMNESPQAEPGQQPIQEDTEDLPAELAEARDREQALNYWHHAAAIFSRDGNRQAHAKALYQLYWASSGDEAESFLTQAVDLGAEEHGWSARAAAAKAIRERNPQAAIEHDRRALELARAHGDRNLEILSIVGTAHGYRELGELEPAIGLVRQAIRLSTLHLSHSWSVQCYVKLLALLEENLQTTEALDECRNLASYIDRNGMTEWSVAMRAWEARLTAIGGDIRSGMSLVDEHVLGGDPGRIPASSVAAATTVLLDANRIESARGLVARVGADGRTSERIRNTLVGRIANAHVDEPLAEQGTDASEVALWLARTGLWRRDRKMLRAALKSSIMMVDSELATPLARLAAQEVDAIDDADRDGSIDALRLVRARWRQSGRRLDALRCSVSIAVAHVYAGRRRSAELEFRAVLTEATELGAGREQREAETNLERLLGQGWNSRVATVLQPFGDLPADIADALASGSTTRKVQRGTLLLTPDRIPDAVYVVRSGLVRLYRDGSSHKALTLGVLDCGDVFGESAVIGVRPAGMYAEALEDCELMCIPPELLDSLANREPTISRSLMSTLEERMRDSHDLAERLAYWSLSRRVAMLMIELDDRYGASTIDGSRVINRTFSQAKLAEMTGTSRSSFNTAFNSLRTAGAVGMRARCIIIVDRVLLDQLACDDDEADAA